GGGFAPRSPPSGNDQNMNAFIQYTVQGLAAGGFYALAALGLAVIFGALGVVNFAHGACYMLGAVAAAVLLQVTGVHFWLALLLVPLIMFVFGVLLEQLFVRWLLKLDVLYNFLLTFGLALVLVDLVKRRYGVSGLPYEQPAGLDGQLQLGSLTLPKYQVFVFVFSLLVCFVVWLLLTRTRVGMIVRAATENPERARALGINVSRWVVPVFGFGIALAGLSGVLAAPFRAITADMGSNFIIVLFAIVVIGGLGSILGAVVAGFLVGMVETYGQAYAGAFSQIAIFILMATIILVRPAGLFGRQDAA
ncbi:MAG: branched-chain amino acid ABC transporter permease, partial [Lacisediminihabitans sp.]